MKHISVRACRSSDLDAVAYLWHASALSTGLDSYVTSEVTDYRERLEAEWRRAWQIYVACENSLVVGFLAFEPERSWLRQLFVAPEKKKAGIGTVLLDRAKSEMQRGFWLRTSSENTFARRFYEARGLRNRGEYPHETLNVAVVRYEWLPSDSSLAR